MEQELNTLKHKRGVIKGQLTRHQTFFNKLDLTNISKFKSSEIKLRIPKLEALLSEFEFVQAQIENLDKSDNAIESHDAVRENFEDVYYSVLGAFHELVSKEKSNCSEIEWNSTTRASSRQSINDHVSAEIIASAGNAVRDNLESNHHDLPSNTQSGTSPSNNNQPNTFHQPNNYSVDQAIYPKFEQLHIKLPQLTLPKFDGSIEQWMNFYDMFSSMIHNNQSLSPIQKFQYLKTSLTGDAAAVIQSLEISTNNYTIAFNLLKERFENKARIIDNHFKALFEFETLNKESHIHLQSLLNNTRKHIRALKSLDLPVEYWDAILIYLTSSKLDYITRREWEKQKAEFSTLPTMEDFCEFLSKKCQLLESLQAPLKHQSSSNDRRPRSAHVSTQKITCKVCNGSHPIYHCQRFLQMNIPSRINEIKKHRICKNCFKGSHITKDCPSPHNCKICNMRHNSLLHLNPKSDQTTTLEVTPSSDSLPAPASVHHSKFTETQVLLPTAIVYAYDSQGNQHEVRILLDSGSQASFITENMVRRLGLNTKHVTCPISGISKSQLTIRQNTSITLHSRLSAYKCTLSCLVLPQITDILPQSSFDGTRLSIPDEIELADPTFSQPSQIDVLVGAEMFCCLLCVGQIQLGKRKPTLQKTQFGWIVSGRIGQNSHRKRTVCNLTTSQFEQMDIQKQMAAFWQVEEINTSKPRSEEEEDCERLFEETTTRAQDGKFVVQLPFNSKVKTLGNSRAIADKRHAMLQRRLQSNPELNDQYAQFINEYINLGHMSLVNYSEEQNPCFLPHHAVVRPDKLTTKTRVVFDASCPTTSGVSLNDALKVGPVVQPTLFTILIRFRLHPVAITSDCEKMYRQVWIHPDHRIFQNIIWNDQTYQLNTLTYGTASAPYLATRCIKQVAIENASKFPEASKIINDSFYVDDLITSFDSITQAKTLIHQIDRLLRSYGFPMRKWSSNFPQILHDMDSLNTVTHFNEHQTIKTLGLDWNSTSDILHYPFKSKTNSGSVTKRTILSTISSLFDPLGLVSPVLVKAKIIMQKLWQLNLGWDESLPMDIHSLWVIYREEFPSIENIMIPRHALCTMPIDIQLHAFSDASETSYGVCVYLRSTDSTGIHQVQLLCAKGRVAPLKVITIPKLELMAAHLLAKLVANIHEAIASKVKITNIYCWCDSTIVLAWIRKRPNQLKTFVAHRVSDILSLTDVSNWQHVSSEDNPADILSRGSNPAHLAESSLWWHGPHWLSADQSSWPKSVPNFYSMDIPEIKATMVATSIEQEPSLLSTLINSHSSLSKLKRVAAWCLRFVNNCRHRLAKLQGTLGVEEIETAFRLILSDVQQESFAEELQQLTQGQPVFHASKLKALNPFLDENKLIRVGGRIKFSNLPTHQKFPLILPSKHALTQLIIRHYHIMHLHAGFQTTLSAIRSTFWILAARSRVKQLIRECVTCKRFTSRPTFPIMGDLPQSRVSPTRPFSVCGTDFAGPFSIKEGRGKGKRTVKSYMCLFVCFSTKAVHIEVVGSLTSEAFLACLKRFLARRGYCREIHSDNSSNYTKSSQEIRDWYKLLSDRAHCDSIANYLSQFSIQWKFIPARAPHFGGLWEAAVKAAKRHLYKIIGTSVLTHEEFHTLCCQIESTLNSRPLIPLSMDPNDFQILTPGHFLVGDSLMALPEPSLLDVPENRLSHFQKIQQLTQQFWKMWSADYLTSLQARNKWQHNSTSPPIQRGSVVLLRDSNAPPLLWRMGRVLHLHPGPDSVVRVATIKTASGIIKRPVVKLVQLIAGQD